jgi:hypothetical protein
MMAQRVEVNVESTVVAGLDRHSEAIVIAVDEAC